MFFLVFFKLSTLNIYQFYLPVQGFFNRLVLFYLLIEIVFFLVDTLFLLTNPVFSFTHLPVSFQNFFIMFCFHLHKLFLSLQFFFLSNGFSPDLGFFYRGLCLY